MTDMSFQATYIVSDEIVDQIRLSLEHIWWAAPEDIPEDNEKAVQFWVDVVLDSTIDNEHEVLLDMDEVDYE